MGMIGVEGSISNSNTDSSGSGSQNQQSNTRRLSYQDEAYVKELMRKFSGGTDADTGTARKQAITDSSDAINELFNQFKNTALPDIMSGQAKTGGYGATTTQLLANDAFSSAVSKGAQLRLNTIADYESRALQKSQLALSGLSTSLQALLQANENSTVDSKYKTKADSSTTTSKLSAGFSF